MARRRKPAGTINGKPTLPAAPAPKTTGTVNGSGTLRTVVGQVNGGGTLA